LQISDLGLFLNKGDVIFIPREKASTSSELALAQRSGAVEVTYVQRSQSVNTPAPQMGSLQIRRPVKIPSETFRKQEPPKVPSEKIEPSRVSLEQTPKKKGRPPKSEVKNNE
jgi:hypothetical protein